MAQNPLDFLNLFVESPGDLLYFLVVIAITQASFFMALGHRSRFPYEKSTRQYVVATFTVLGVWVLVLAGALLSLLMRQDANSILPPLERLAYSITLLVLSWAYLGSDRDTLSRNANIVLLVSIVSAIILYIVTAFYWRDSSATILAFNASLFAPLWSGVSVGIVLVAIGILAVKFSSIVDSPIKSIVFIVVLLGEGFNLVQFSQGELVGSYLGSTRLAYVSALVMLPLIIYRLAVASLENSVSEVARTASHPLALPPPDAPQLMTATIDVLTVSSVPSNLADEEFSDKLFKAVYLMTNVEEREQLTLQIVKGVIEALAFDVGVLLKLKGTAYADIVAGYDRTKARIITGMPFVLDTQPTLATAIQQQSQCALLLDHHADELDDIYRRLDINQQGTAYIQPLVRRGELVAILLVGFPYQQRELNALDTELLRELGIVAGNLLGLSLNADDASGGGVDHDVLQAKIEELTEIVSVNRVEQDALKQRIQELSAENNNLVRQCDQLQLQLNMASSDRSDGVHILTVEQFTALQAMIKSLSEQREKLKQELETTQNLLTEARHHNEKLQADMTSGGTTASLSHSELLLNLVQALRTPMDATADFLALLLSESDETLEETQIDLLQHIKANMQRLSTMIDDLVKILQLNTGIFDFQYTAVDVITLVEDTITQAANQLRDKDLSVNLALDDATPHIYADADSIRHIFEYMLTNAYLASSVGSEIAIQVGVEHVSLLSELSLEDVVLISVCDQRDVVPDDTGAGMLITKLFTEAHGGRMWFEPDEGGGSVFKVALPIQLMVDEES